MNPLHLLAAFLALALTGCSPTEFLRESMAKIAPDEDEAIALACVHDTRRRNFDALTARLDPGLVKADLSAKLEQMAAMLDHGEPVTVELVGCNVTTNLSKRTSHLTYQLTFDKTFALVAVVIETEDQNARVTGLHVTPIPHSLGEMNALSFADKSPTHFVFLALLIAIPAFILVALVVCICTPLRGRKWLWILFIIFGIGQLQLNWTTGGIGYNPLSISVHLFGAGIVKNGPYAPWILTLSLPLGAIVFLLRRRNLARPESPPPLAATNGPAPTVAPENPEHPTSPTS